MNRNIVNISDSIPSNQVIGGVSVYPLDDSIQSPKHEVQPISREIVDRFIKTITGYSCRDALFKALARRLTAKTGGETVQNINMLELLRRIVNGEAISETDPLFSEVMKTITGAVVT